MKRFLLLMVLLSALSGCAWMQGRDNPKPAPIPAPDPSVVERDLSKPYVPEATQALPDGGAP
jgi:hypothetical protein